MSDNKEKNWRLEALESDCQKKYTASIENLTTDVYLGQIVGSERDSRPLDKSWKQRSARDGSAAITVRLSSTCPSLYHAHCF
ncbi:unnamed protein product [Heligmosomoides polygyrus]|uniref:Uncharacterized protein n=1 Tax=Heligmosomoides polygyrus TaxID=6339 RepID=A0A183G2U8_HELPZ|nr:unnamed protein product [Heligmosomoides polygyrus]